MFEAAFILRNWKAAICGITLLILASTAAYYRIDRDHWRGVARALRIDLDKVEEATKLADQKARAAKLAQEAEYRRKADETDAKYEAALHDARARAVRYADAHRVPAPARSPTGRSTAPADDSGAEGSQRPGEDSGVVITREDFDTLTENTLRLKAAHDWACGLEGAKCE